MYTIHADGRLSMVFYGWVTAWLIEWFGVPHDIGRILAEHYPAANDPQCL